MRRRPVDRHIWYHIAASGRASRLSQKRAFVLIMSTASPFCFADSQYSRAGDSAAVVTGAFVQLTPDIATQHTEEWDRQLRAMATLGMDTLVVQYVALGNKYYYPTKIGGTKSSQNDSIGRLFDCAQRSGIKVFLGLHFDRSFWRGEFDPKKRLEQNRVTLDELWQQFGCSPVLAGWYIPEEVDDRTPSRGFADGLLGYFRSLTEQAHRISGLPVMISPYFGQKADVKAYAQWWDEVALPTIGVDIVALQDGVGTHRTTITESRAVFAALAPVMKRHRVAFWANNECFHQTHGWPLDGKAWSAEPTSIDGFVRQVQATSPFVEKSITFEFCHYLDPERSTKARALFRGYQDYLRRLATPRPHVDEAIGVNRRH